MKLRRIKSGIWTRALSELCAASLLFFFFYTAPHRVHHSFDQLTPATHPHADNHKSDSDQPIQSPVASDCVFQASASRCTFGLVAPLHLLPTALRLQDPMVFAAANRPPRLLDNSFQIRAPPAA